MNKAAWLSDIHLNFLTTEDCRRFVDSLKATGAESIWISGDIGEADSIKDYLEMIAERLEIPVHFVLGNHDYYRSSINTVRTEVREFCSNSERLNWLSDGEVAEVSPEIGLVGHDSWADGGFGDFQNSNLIMSDFFLIEDFNRLKAMELSFDQVLRNTTELFEIILGDNSKKLRLETMKALAEEAALHFHSVLPPAMKRYPHVYLLSHVPPFKQACRHQGKPSDDFGLPYFSCKTVGDILIRIMKEHPENHLTVLCGHTHDAAEARILDNLEVYTAQAEYGHPRVQKIIVV